ALQLRSVPVAASKPDADCKQTGALHRVARTFSDEGHDRFLSLRCRAKKQIRKETVVGKLILSEFVTLDGVMEDPGGDEGFPLGGWQVPFFDEALNDAAQVVLAEADALLLGRVTFERFSRVWPSITDEQGFAEKMNAMPKFVASNTLTEPIGWHGKVI